MAATGRRNRPQDSGIVACTPDALGSPEEKSEFLQIKCPCREPPMALSVGNGGFQVA
jgi:hypothetical protein